MTELLIQDGKIVISNGFVATNIGSTSESIALISIGAIAGIKMVGEQLVAENLIPSEATVSYQWSICDTVNGIYVNISGATENIYSPIADDIGKFIKVTATGIGSYSGVVTSPATEAIAAAPSVDCIEISGVAGIGAGFSMLADLTSIAQMTWADAEAFIAQMNLSAAGGYTNWRQPSFAEWQAFLGVAGEGSAVSVLLDDPRFTGVQWGFYWSSTTDTEDAGYAMGIGLGSGFSYSEDKLLENYVWPVRDTIVWTP